MDQDLYNDMVERPLVVSLRDAAADNAPIGTGEISLVPLLHDATEVQTSPTAHLFWVFSVRTSLWEGQLL